MVRKSIEWGRLEISSRKLIYQGNFSYKDGHNKGQKWMDLTEVENIKKKGQEYKERYTKKIIMTNKTRTV